MIPTRIASAPVRNLIPLALAFSPVIHLDSPAPVAIFPSSDIAALTVTNGRWRTIQWWNASFNPAASAASKPVLTARPARSKISNPRPQWAGFGSRAAATTRRMPAPMIASVQGGVRPWVQHGSSVTYKVLPAAPPFLRASASASISA